MSKIVKLPFWETSKDEIIKGKKKYSSTYFKEKSKFGESSWNDKWVTVNTKRLRERSFGALFRFCSGGLFRVDVHF